VAGQYCPATIHYQQMKKLVVAIICLFAVANASHAQPPQGSKAPEISLPNVNGEMINLSSFRGKVVLLDFWASWCGPCRRNNKEVMPVYEKYHDKGFEIFGVSLDDNKPSWLKAIQQDKMKWKNVIDLKAAYGNELTQTWNLQTIPSTFLIDKKGNLIARDVEKETLEKLLEKLL